jgi:hypothetical protein
MARRAERKGCLPCKGWRPCNFKIQYSIFFGSIFKNQKKKKEYRISNKACPELAEGNVEVA